MSFANTPISKGLIYSVGITSFVCSSFGKKHWLSYPLSPHITRDHQYWRLFAHHLGFTNTSDVFFATLVLVNIAPTIERFFGNVKFGSFVAVSGLIVTLVEFCGLVGLSPLGLSNIPAGPFGIVFAILYQYYVHVPVSYYYRVFGLTLSDKSLMYFLSLQLLLTQSSQAVLPCAAGVLASMLYQTPGLSLSEYRLPLVFQKIMTALFLPLVGRSNAPPRSGRTSLEDESDEQSSRFGRATTSFASAAAGVGSGTGGAGGPRNNNVDNVGAGGTGAGVGGSGSGSGSGASRRATGQAATSSIREYLETFSGSPGSGGRRPPQPSPEQIEELRVMFPQVSREQVAQALTSADGDVNRAAELLLNLST